MNILMVNPHPDDIEISCLGTYLRHQESGDYIIYVCVSECEDLKRNKTLPDEVREVMRILKPDEQYRLKMKNRKLNYPKNMEKLRRHLERIRDRKQIDRVYCPWEHDIHQDHRSVAEEVIRIFRLSTILQYENPHCTIHLSPNYYVEIPENTYKKKMKILEIFKSQDTEYLTELCRRTMEIRGIEITHEYAEAFKIWRMIE